MWQFVDNGMVEMQKLLNTALAYNKITQIYNGNCRFRLKVRVREYLKGSVVELK